MLPIYVFDHPVLRRKAKPIRSVDADVRRLAGDMMQTMHEAGGIGLAANQVGALHRIIVVDVSDMEEHRDLPPMMMLNPEILKADGIGTMEEGCLSIPDLRDEVERPETITVRYRNLEFEPKEVTLTGLPGRVVQHELDHLNGVLFFDHLNAIRRKLLRGRLNKIRRGEIETRYPVVGGPEFQHRSEIRTT